MFYNHEQFLIQCLILTTFSTIHLWCTLEMVEIVYLHSYSVEVRPVDQERPMFKK
jgi:hypothetical protein